MSKKNNPPVFFLLIMLSIPCTVIGMNENDENDVVHYIPKPEKPRVFIRARKKKGPWFELKPETTNIPNIRKKKRFGKKRKKQLSGYLKTIEKRRLFQFQQHKKKIMKLDFTEEHLVSLDFRIKKKRSFTPFPSFLLPVALSAQSVVPNNKKPAL